MKYTQDKNGFLIHKYHRERPGGDSCWMSSWLYASYCVIGAKNPRLYKSLQADTDPDPVKSVERFLYSYMRLCVRHDRMLMYPGYDQFSRDQLCPLLMLLVAVKKHQPHLQHKAREIIQHIVKLDDNQERLHPKCKKSELNNSLRYVVTKVADLYGVKYRRRVGSGWFVSALAGYDLMWQARDVLGRFIGKDLVNKAVIRPYSVWNQVALLSAVAMIYGLDRDVQAWRKLFKTYARQGFGVGYKIVAGMKYNPGDVTWYRNLTRWRNVDIGHQRGPEHMTYKQGRLAPPQVLTLDYPVLKALQLIWRNT